MRLAMPLGGIGTGTVSLGGRGDLRNWEIANRPGKGFNPAGIAGPACFVLYAKPAGGQAVTRLLEGPLPLEEYEGPQGSTARWHGMPRFRECSFAAAYPLGQVHLSDRDVPLAVTLQAFNPMIPADADSSGIPVAVLRYVLRNRTGKRVTAAVCGSLPNFIGTDGSQHVAGWTGVHSAAGMKCNRNQFRDRDGIRGIFMDSPGVDPKAEAWGTIALTTTAKTGITRRTGWAKLSFGDTKLDFWDEFSATGEVTEREEPGSDNPTASLAVKVTVPPHGTKTVTFLLTWHFPNRQTWTPKPLTGPANTGFVQAWSISGFLPLTGGFASLALPPAEQRQTWAKRTFSDAFANLHQDIGCQGKQDLVVYYACHLRCAERMLLNAKLGYDGPVKLWVDGREVFCDPAGTNPASPDDTTVPFESAAGEHEVVVGLGTNRGQAYGIFLAFERTGMSRKSQAAVLPPPEIVDQHPPACGCSGGCDPANANMIGNYYTTQYRDAWDVAAKVAPRLAGLETATVEFVKAFCASDLPLVVKEAALFNVSTLRTQTCFRTPDGRFFAWEGCNDNCGCCSGSCTHVWNYEQATAFLFGDLSCRLREVEFNHGTDERGLMSFRVMLPIARASELKCAAADGQMGCLLKLYRDWQLSGDDGMLRALWPKARQAMEFCWIPGGWDGDRDGVMEGCQHNTMDVEYFGPNPQMNIWYLGALRATEEMARYVGDDGFAATCRRLFEKGRQWVDANLFNGDYYEHQIRPPKDPKDIAEGLLVGMGATDLSEPICQLGAGCLVDQLVGQFLSEVCGLGYLVDRAHVRKTLKSIIKYNRRAGFNSHFNHMRSFVLGDETALLMASYPKGRRPKRPFPYFTEVMTGFEHTVAVHLLYEGMIREGLQCLQDVRDRYDGRKRNPFDEAECGHHYGRAMVTWAAVLALTGFQYSGVSQAMQFKARPGRFFWSNGYAWGTCRLKKTAAGWNVELNVMHGTLKLRTFTLQGAGSVALARPTMLKTGHPLAMTVKR
jgi:uncharacterized protein (DUF608 family)